MNLQKIYDLDLATKALGKAITKSRSALSNLRAPAPEALIVHLARRWHGAARSRTEEVAMTIKREDIDRRIVDFSDVASGRRLPPVHPGKILRDEFLTPMRISVYELAKCDQRASLSGQ
jgi:hypothetical protein